MADETSGSERVTARSGSDPIAEIGGFSFKGTDRFGVSRTGVQSGDVFAFVEAKYEGRWQSLTVTQGEVEVGGICRMDDGRLTWWAEVTS